MDSEANPSRSQLLAFSFKHIESRVDYDRPSCAVAYKGLRNQVQSSIDSGFLLVRLEKLRLVSLQLWVSIAIFGQIGTTEVLVSPNSSCWLLRSSCCFLLSSLQY